MITNNHLQNYLIGSTANFSSMKKTFIALSIFWAFASRHFILPFCSQSYSINHFTFGIAWMHTTSFNKYFCITSIKGLVIKFTKLTTIDSISKIRAKFI